MIVIREEVIPGKVMLGSESHTTQRLSTNDAGDWLTLKHVYEQRRTDGAVFGNFTEVTEFEIEAHPDRFDVSLARDPDEREDSAFVTINIPREYMHDVYTWLSNELFGEF